MLRNVATAALGLALALAAHGAAAAETNPFTRPDPHREPVGRLLVRLRAPVAVADGAHPVAERIAAVGTRTRLSLKLARSLTADIHVLRLLVALEDTELAATLARLRADPAVEYADPDRRRFAAASTVPPDDPLYAATSSTSYGQWYLQAPMATPHGTTVAAVDAVGAWGLVTGSAGIVIADLDTGVRFDHPDLGRAESGGKLLPGYDFVGADGDGASSGTAFNTANDGDGWDADPSDPGDWISSADTGKSVFSACAVDNSSWHGTRTAGILGARSNNGVGIAGIAWNTWILPVRVLGKCGGYDSDILAGMLWASGVPVSGVPNNAYPARIINMSLGGDGSCSRNAGSYQDVIAQLARRGTVVVASAGNDGAAVGEPANCPGAIAVAGVRHAGTKVGYSNLGPEIAVAAPAGNCVNNGGACLFSIDTTSNSGTTVPGTNGYTNQLDFNVGTSFSAPIVSGIVALMLSANGNLTPAEIVKRLGTAARPFPVVATDDSGAAVPMCVVPSGGAIQAFECNCTTSTCGAGLADAAGSVREALRPIAAIGGSGAVVSGATVALSGAGSGASCGHTLASYSWAIRPDSTAGGTPALSSLTGATTSVIAPASGTIDVELTVTDEDGRTDTATITVSPTLATTTTPSQAGNQACPVALPPPTSATTTPPAAPASGGGGGALDPLALGALLVLARRRARAAAGSDPGTRPTPLH